MEGKEDDVEEDDAEDEEEEGESKVREPHKMEGKVIITKLTKSSLTI